MWRWDQQEPFGNNVPDEDPSGLGTFDLPLRLPGQRYDKETNLHYNYFRDYDPSTGRYIEADPLGGAPTWPDVPTSGINNLFAYASGAPLAAADQLGLLASFVVPGAATSPASSNPSSQICVASSKECTWINLYTRVGETCPTPPPQQELWQVQFSFDCSSFREVLIAKCTYRGYPGGGPRARANVQR